MKVTFQIEGGSPVQIECNAGENLLELARRANVAIDAPCSGNGSCISVDTIPLVGEENIAEAVDAVNRLPRVSVLVLAGSLMGGKITETVRELKKQHEDLIVITLNMPGSVTEEADLIVTDPIQAGVMAVMAVASTAVFDVKRLAKNNKF